MEGATMSDTKLADELGRKVCTKENPNPGSIRGVAHPDAQCVYELNDYGDELWRCPNCGYQWTKEGADA